MFSAVISELLLRQRPPLPWPWPVPTHAQPREKPFAASPPQGAAPWGRSPRPLSAVPGGGLCPGGGRGVGSCFPAHS